MPKRWSGILFQAARRSRDLEALASGDPKRILRRGKNLLLGRLLARTLFRWLWR